MNHRTLLTISILAASLQGPAGAADTDHFLSHVPGKRPLTWEDDIASRMVDGIDRFLLRKLADSVAQRERHWNRDYQDREAYEASIAANRDRLTHILGVRDPRVPFDSPELIATVAQPALVGRGDGYEVFAVRWPVLRNIHGEGLLLVPDGGHVHGRVVAIPDADQTPEALAGLEAGRPPTSQYARRLAENGLLVLVPALVSRELKPRNKRAVLTSREYLYRSSFELGRHLIGYEVQRVLAGIDWFRREPSDAPVRVGVMGWGEGGLLALYAGALDTRIDAVCVSGYFDSRQNIWREPIDRNVFGLLDQFGDAELAAMIAPRPLIVEACRGPELELNSKGVVPARLVTPDLAAVQAEVQRAGQLSRADVELVVVEDGRGPCGSAETLRRFLHHMGRTGPLSPAGSQPEDGRRQFDPREREHRLIDEIDQHNQWLLQESPYARREFMKRLDTRSLTDYVESSRWYRDFFRDEVIGCFDDQLLPPKPRIRKSYDNDKWTGYEVVLDVLPDVLAYGILLLPKDMATGDRRPVVVCQHGLEGRPQQVVRGDHRAYHDFAAKLAARGFITFAPQNIYIFGDRFRSLQRKANPLKKTLFSVMVPQHEQIVRFLSSLPCVDPERIAFYGLSYGGKSAMRIPALVEGYCLSICSADFNDWVWKNVSTRARYSYVWTGEYEIFEFDLGSTFNYSDMAALIAPRPFMVERGHFDGVAPDERVAYEFAKVRHLYNAQLGIGDRCAIEWFVGPHTIHGQGTFRFLHQHLAWPESGR